MSGVPWSRAEETELACHLAASVCDQATGRRDTECLYNYPRDVYFIGNLRPRREKIVLPEGQGQQQARDELLNKLAPMAFGAEFLVCPDEHVIEFTVELSWAVYYRVIPSFTQQSQHQRRVAANEDGGVDPPVASETSTYGSAPSYTGSNEADVAAVTDEESETASGGPTTESTESASDRRQRRRPNDSLFIRFKKITCQASGKVVLSIGAQGQWSLDHTHLDTAIGQELDRARTIVVSDPQRIRTAGSAEEKIRVPDEALFTEEAYTHFIQRLRTEVLPQWGWEIRGEVWKPLSTGAMDSVLTLEFINTSPMPENSPNTEAFFFDTGAKFLFTRGHVKPFVLELAPRGYRYDPHVRGRGINCALEQQERQSSSDVYATTHAPIFRQLRYQTRTTPRACFSDLANDPIPILDAILKAMEQYRTVWRAERQRFAAADPAWESEHGSEFDRDQAHYDEEIEAFRKGYEAIRLDADARKAFELTNETFRRGSKTEWRLFQVVFLVVQIPGIVSLAKDSPGGASDRQRVDIIYFPTGGGKTEAYLASIIFHCFFDRLRGKTAGVTAWTRFPLRLLTLQQTQRVADVIGVAELVRREQTDPRLSGPCVDGFAVGYFVGQGGSPNEIVPPQGRRNSDPDDYVTWSRANDPDARQEWKRVVRCPACKTATVSLDFDAVHTRLVHRCSQPNCSFDNGEIPVYIVDNEIYRYLPCVIVGTIDKLAGIGNQRKFSLVLGQVDGRCSLHGYYKGKCCQKDCKDESRLREGIPSGLSGPTLFVQDELHLLKEGLGTFDGHYETFVQRLLQEFGAMHDLKIIASSATIEAFERQITHLYGRDPSQAWVFPGQGPTLGQSFYAETLDFPQRLFVGLIPHNKTIFNTILELIELYHREVLSLQRLAVGAPNPYGGTLAPGTATWNELLDFFATSLTYFLANRELNSIRTDLEGDVLPRLQRDRQAVLEISELTGSTTTDDVSALLERLENPATPDSPPNAVLATSMVSHGVDIDRFNAMFFYGMPRQNAEYIQASSRVGRSHIGIVFTCLHPVRERDQSHYAYFIKFHQFLGQLVEPVAINRWSKFSVNRTLPGLFMAVLLQWIAHTSGERNPNRYYMLDFLRGKVSDGSIKACHFVPLLEEAYGVNSPQTPAEESFRDEIRERVQQYLDWILSPSSGQSFVSDVLIPKPMRSLRDVDEAIPIELDTLGTQWTAQRGRS